MFDVKDYVCIGGTTSKPCEDAVGYGKNYCFVIDGASVLSKINIVDEQSDAAWFATQIKERLCARFDVDNKTPTDVILKEIIDDLNRIYCDTAIAKCMEIPSDSPSAGIALFRQMSDEIEFYGVGDCTGAIKMMDGNVEVLKDNRLCALDGCVIERMAELHRKTGISVLEAREKCNDLLLNNRSKRNKDGGYWILDLSGIGIGHATICSWPAESVKTVFACSDGFAQLIDTFCIYENYDALMEVAQDVSLLSLCDTLFDAQNKDSEANEFPRFKLRDDTSCLWGIIK